MKKTVIILVLIYLISVLCACGAGSPAPAPGSSAASVSTGEPTPEPTPQPTPEPTPQLYTEAPTEPFVWAALLDFPDPVPHEANPEERMAHNIYSDPVLDSYKNSFSGFLIDFRADYDAACTYWALCNWEMDTSDLQRSSKSVLDTGGAYAGLQNTESGKKAIMSFWEIRYVDENGTESTLNASRVFPETNKTNTFGGEGEGTNYITDYSWEAGKWYRMYLTCYDDADTGHTFVEQWFQDLETGDWTKICCFDTGLSHSFFKGTMSQFMENYDFTKSDAVRSFALRNMYVRDYATGKWLPVTGSVLSVDTWWDNKKGSFAFTADECTLYGITCGYGEDTATLNEDISEYFHVLLTEKAQTPPID